MVVAVWVLAKKKTIEQMKELREHWSVIMQSGEYYAWRGNVFETICYQHILPICQAASITQVNFMGNWRAGAQIDLLFDRDDGTTTLCEIKCTDQPFVINTPYAENLRAKLNAFREKTKTSKHLILVFISAHGLEQNTYAKEFVHWSIDLEAIINAC